MTTRSALPAAASLLALLLGAAILPAACSTRVGTLIEEENERLTEEFQVLSEADYNTRHHGAGVFLNPWPGEWPGESEEPLIGGLCWSLGFACTHAVFSRSHPDTPFRPAGGHDPDDNADAKTGRAPGSASIEAHWLGHATVFLKIGEARVLTDPHFGDKSSPVPLTGPYRRVPKPLPMEKLGRVDVVVISHDHYDHLDQETIIRLHRMYRPLFLTPLRLKSLLLEWGVTRVMELAWRQYVDHAGLRIHCSPAKHFSGRSLLNRDETLWAAWYIEHKSDGRGVYFGGDTGYGPHFRETRLRRGKAALAMLPIGAYEPPWLMRRIHVDPEEAVRAFVDLEAEHMLAIHWGTFDLADEPLLQPADRARDAARVLGLEKRVHVVPVGGSVMIRSDPR